MMKRESSEIEARRINMQHTLDAQKTQKQRNVMGQFATPFPLACDIMRFMHSLNGSDGKVSMLEPSAGLGAFISAFREVYGDNAGHTLGFEIDSHYYAPAVELWQGCDVELRNADFTGQAPDSVFDMIVANPPYVRHHHIATDTKMRLRQDVRAFSKIDISGLAGLYCHFMILSTRWLCPDGLSCWLVPCEFMEVNYGKAVKQFLLESVELVRIHRFVASDLQFADALVSSCVVVFRNAKPSANHNVVFSQGGSMSSPDRQWNVASDTLAADDKWTGRFADATDTCHTGDKVYLLLYPKKDYAKSLENHDVRERVWYVLNNISKSRLMNSGRVYGGGLYKMEPKELMNMPMPEMTEILQPKKDAVQLSLF